MAQDQFPAIRYRAAALLALTLAFGLNSMFGQVYCHGWMGVVSGLLDSSNTDAVLPLTQRPILKHYTGWAEFDKLLALASIMFVNVVDGSTLQLSLYAFQFAGQLVPVFTIMMIEGLRAGNRNNVFYYSVIWGYMMQMTGYATTMPIYCMIHLFVSPAATSSPKAIRPRYLGPLDLRAIVPAFTIGYGLLTVLFAYPFSSNFLRQWMCAIWQGFPHYVVGIQYVVACFLSSRRVLSSAHSRSWCHDREALARVYNFAFAVAAATQVLTIVVMCIANAAPCYLPNGMATSLTFYQVFVPGPFYSTEPLTSMATEMHNFYLYDQYVGSTAALIWSLTLWAGSTQSKHFPTPKEIKNLGMDICCWGVCAGPAGAALRIIQRRDEVLMSQQGSHGNNSNSSSDRVSKHEVL